jgi:hypothetical protein
MDRPRIDEFGNKRWFVNNKLHRIDGPAIEYINGEKNWWVNGKLHRTDGPAAEYTSGERWYLDNQVYTFDNWLKLNPDLTYGEKVMMKLQYG